MRVIRKLIAVFAVAAAAAALAAAAEAATRSYEISGYYPSASSLPYGPSGYAWTGAAWNATETGYWTAVIPADFGAQAGAIAPGGYFDLTRTKKKKILGKLDATFTGGTFETATAECGIRIYAVTATLAVEGGGTADLAASIKAHQQLQGASCVTVAAVLETGTVTYTLP